MLQYPQAPTCLCLVVLLSSSPVLGFYVQGNLLYEEVRLPMDVNATGVYEERWFNPVYLPYNPLICTYIVSFCQALSHTIESRVPPYITGTTHWESTHTHLWRYNGPRHCCYKVLAIFPCFPVLSVAVAYFSWPHLVGTEVLYLMSGIGYKHGYFTKFRLITEKAELSGNPRCAYFPSSADTLMNVSVITLWVHSLIRQTK